MCLVILILPLAQLMKNLKAHGYFNGVKRFLPFSDPSEVGQRGEAQDDRTHIISFCHSDPACLTGLGRI